MATSAGYCLAAFPAYFPIDIAVAVATAGGRRRDEAAIGIASACWVAGAVAWWGFDLLNLWGPRPDGWLVGGAVAVSGVIRLAFVRAARRRRTVA